MKMSIIVPVYNEEEMIKTCLKALSEIDYPKRDYEVIVVNDGSTDRTKKSIEDFIRKEKKTKFKLVNQKNSGRALTRENGARLAKNENLLFTDSRCTVHSDILKQVAKSKYKIIVGNPLTDKESALGRFGYLFRKKLFKGSFENFKSIEINKANFDDISKGTTVLFCKKKLFLSSQLDNQQSKDNSDDTKLLWNLLEKAKIEKNPDVKVTYHPRTSLKNHIKHTYERGPKFVDYYFKPGRKYFPYILSMLFALAILLGLLMFYPVLFGYSLLTLLALDILVSVYLSEKFSDFTILATLMPLTGAMFTLGILKGIFMKILGRY